MDAMTESHFMRDMFAAASGPVIGILGNAVFSDPNLKTASLALGAVTALLVCLAKAIELYRKIK